MVLLSGLLPGLIWLQGMPLLKKILVAFYIVAGLAAAGVVVWYVIKKRAE